MLICTHQQDLLSVATCRKKQASQTSSINTDEAAHRKMSYIYRARPTSRVSEQTSLHENKESMWLQQNNYTACYI